MANYIEEYLTKKADLDKTPLKGSLELTPLCNLDCKMCYIHHTKEEADREGGIKDVHFWISLVREMKKAGTLFINLIGGEPLIYPDIDILYNDLITNGFKVTMTTNGFMLSKGIPSWMMQKKPRFVIVSLYGASNDTYGNLSGDYHGFDKVIKALENLKEAQIPTKINICLSPYNQNDLASMYAIAKRYTTNIDSTAYMFPPVRKVNGGSDSYIRFTAEEAAKVELGIQKCKASKEKYLDYCNYLSCGIFEQNTAKHTTHFSCKAGSSNFWVNWHGELTACGMLEEPYIDLTKIRFIDAWKQLVNSIEKINTCEECAVCDKRAVCNVCPAIMKAETGSFLGTPTYCCDFLDQKIKYAKSEI